MDNRAVSLAIGRIFRLASRPTQPGDVQDYERCRALILDAICGEGIVPTPPWDHDWARDRLKGAAGDW